MIILDPNTLTVREETNNLFENQRRFTTGQTNPFGVFIAIGDLQIGNGDIRVIGSDEYKLPFKSMNFPLYEIAVYDIASKKITQYSVTRDAPVINTKNPTNTPWIPNDTPIIGPLVGSETTYNIINTAFEPVTNKGEYYLVPRDNYPVPGLEAYALKMRGGSAFLPAVPVDSPDRGENKNLAKDIMIHIGGHYTYPKDGYKALAGSYGCFGLYEGNSKWNAFVNNDVVPRQNLLKRKKMPTLIPVTVIKRQNVTWSWKTDKTGKIIG